ncbi:hypothetical protein HYU20_02955 [Candidatus Woesearchaeota archaeon]|nr:hypothetical protein [Candidatus Woesearchaeota archaeon]
MMNDEDKSREGLEATVKDAYIIYAETKGLDADERQQKYAALLQRAEELQQQYGSEKFGYMKFEYVKDAIAATIKEKEIVDLLVRDGYVVKEQGRMRAL